MPKIISSVVRKKNSQKPEEVSYRSHRKAVFMCPDHGEYTSVIQSITSRISSNSFSLGYPICFYIQSGISNSTPNVGASFADLYPNLLKEYSDQNTKNPWSINPGTKYKATWICSKGHVWVTSVQHRTRSKSGCPLCFASNHTSLIETNLRTSLETLGFSQELRSKVEHWNVDLLNSDIKTVIEFDGSYYHSLKGAYARDRKKSLDLLVHGYRVIRIRERTKRYQLKSLRISKKLDYHEIFWDNNYTSVYPENVDSEVLEEIKTLVLQPNNI